MYNEKNNEVVRIYNETKEFLFIKRNEEKSEGDLICVLDMNVPLCVPIYIFRQLTKLSNEEIYSQAKENLTKSEFDDKFYSDEKLSRQLRVARNIKSLLAIEELRNFRKEQIKFIAEKVEIHSLKIIRNFEELKNFSFAFEEECTQNYTNSIERKSFSIENLEELKTNDYDYDYKNEYGETETLRYEFEYNFNKLYLILEKKSERKINRFYDFPNEIEENYVLYIPENCIFSSFDEDIVEIIKKFNL